MNSGNRLFKGLRRREGRLEAATNPSRGKDWPRFCKSEPNPLSTMLIFNQMLRYYLNQALRIKKKPSNKCL